MTQPSNEVPYVDPDPELTPAQEQLIEDMFTYHPPTGDRPQRHQAINEGVKDLARTILRVTPPGRNQRLALDQLQIARMMANAAIACPEREGTPA